MLVLSFITRLWGVLAGRDPAGRHHRPSGRIAPDWKLAVMTLTTRFKRMHSWPIEKVHSLLSRTHQRRTEHSLDTGTDLDHNEVLQILVDNRRRYALEFLASQPTGETVSLSDLADVVAARENDCSLQEVTSTQRKRVYIALYQRHSDSMSEIVDIDTDRKMFTVTVATKRAWAAYTAFQQKLTG